MLPAPIVAMSGGRPTPRGQFLLSAGPRRGARGDVVDASSLVVKSRATVEPTEEGTLMNTRTIAIAALVVAVIVLLFFLL